MIEPTPIEVHTKYHVPLLRNSERSSFKECPQQWDWAWQQGLIPAMPRADARWFGSGLHLALAEWYMPEGAKNGFARGGDPRETFDRYAGDAWATVAAQPYFDEEAEVEYIDARKLGGEMLGNYVDFYEGTDPTVEVIFPEYRYTAKIPFNERQSKDPRISGDEKFITIIVGTFDMVFRDQVDSCVKLMDHKSAAKKESMAHLVKDDQAGTYIAVSTNYLRAKGILKSTESVVGMTYNYLRKSRKAADKNIDERGVRHNNPTKEQLVEAILQKTWGQEDADGKPVFTRSELMKLKVEGLEAICTTLELKVWGKVSAESSQPATLFWREDVRRSKKNRLKQIERIADDAEMIQLARAGSIPILKNPGKHCSWCDFKELCDVHEDQEDVEGFIKAVFVSRDMYADHRDGAVNSKTSAANDKVVKSNVTKVNFGGNFG